MINGNKVDRLGCYLSFLFLGVLDIYVRPGAIATILYPEAMNTWIKGQHSKNDGEERKDPGVCGYH